MKFESRVRVKLDKDNEGQKLHDAAVLLMALISSMNKLPDAVKLECIDDYHGDYVEYTHEQLIDAFNVINSIAECYDNLEIVPEGCEHNADDN